AELAELETIIRPCGLYRTKAESIIAFSKIIVGEYGGEVPADMDTLLSLPGVGRKIANLILGDVFGKPGIVADTHCIRICGRLGFYPESLTDAYKVEKALDPIIPKDEQALFCHRIVHFGRQYCTARSPRCDACPLYADCAHASGASPLAVMQENTKKTRTLSSAHNMKIPSEVKFVISRLESHGYRAYAVGGCVRDHLLGKIPLDYDVTTSASPQEMCRVFSDCRLVETGLKHGTLTVVKNGMNIETTTYRIDGEYHDGRHPDSVTFTDKLSEDLRRRDFSINAMAYSPADGVIDLWGGRRDLAARVIRCVGRAEERFSEDGLRILRAMRFASVLSFECDKECTDAIFSLTHLLKNISRERIYTELTKLICGDNAPSVLEKFASVVSFVLPELSEENVRRASSSILALHSQSDERNPAQLYALLLSDLDSSAAESAISSLKPSRAEKRRVLDILKHKDSLTEGHDLGYTVKKIISETDDSIIESIVRVSAARGTLDEEKAVEVLDLTAQIIERDECRSISGLSVRGADMIELGLSGTQIGQTLDEVLERVMRGELSCERDEILEYVKNVRRGESK
ncbi:MAG: CCA tRNA nucleotidyltransferase, partial [Clostridia bacterium]|nr:CCA tRNA nucleotidyltransferase [Clostridia bacterium]